MQEWWWSLVPMVAVATGFAARRWIEGRRTSEGLKRKLQALTLVVGMKKHGLQLKDLRDVERDAAK